jgi:hypothetical protein
MVEAVVVIPTFILLFTASIFVWELYTQKEKTMADTRFKLWTYAISDNCGDPGQPGVGGNDAPSVSLTGDVSTAQATNGLEGTGFSGDTSGGESKVQAGDTTGTLSKSLGSVTYGEQGAMVKAGGAIGGFQSTTTARRIMQCNEPPHNGTLVGLAKAAVHTLTSW